MNQNKLSKDNLVTSTPKDLCGWDNKNYNMEKHIQISSKSKFKDSDEFNDYASEKLSKFLENIETYPQYTYPATGEMPLIEFEEGISFYYTQKGMSLVDRWKKRMQAIFDHYFEEGDFRPFSSMYKEF